ncbi:MAG: flagellar hook assembly protein FlgD [Burkholderiaceae bacterium]|nr:flagellar hook assembly protein FlgD [Burkholderiaceae bacterium]
MATHPISSNSGAASTAGVSNASANASSEDRFLKLLVAQLKNQDPLNPMDNAQVTSQMAQIQTVSGIEKLNSTVLGLNTQFAQLQTLGGAALVGRNVLIEGNRMAAIDGAGHGGFELASQADRVTLEVLDGAGRVIDSVNLGAHASGRHSFDWTPPAGVDASHAAKFRISATLGANAVAHTTYTQDRVDAVSAGVDGLVLELTHAGPVGYDKVKVFD